MESNKFYTDEQNAQILLYLLKQHGIKRVIASPGATNVALVASMQHDPFFEMYSCVDERSAAYMACGMAEESGDPVVLSCTGATSSRNYMPGLTEAFYRNLPILVVTSSMDNNRLGHLYAQFTDRSSPPRDCVKKSYHIQWIKDKEDYWDCSIKLNNALLELTHGNPGPIHVNMVTRFSVNFNVENLPSCKIINKYSINDTLPELPSGNIAIFIGQHKIMSVQETNAIDDFCYKNDAVVLADHTSGYTGKYKILSALIASQERKYDELMNIDVLIHIGDISGDYYTIRNIRPKQVWRVARDGVLRDRFKKLSCVFEMPEMVFFNKYAEIGEKNKTDFFQKWQNTYNHLIQKIESIPFSTIWIASVLSKRIPSGATLYLSILNVLRSWNFYNLENQVSIVSNVGGFGIDGMSSSLIGASLVNPNKLFFGITGDLNFFYDLNILGNRHVGNNIRILVINNGHGQEFRTYKHKASVLGDETDDFIAAARHFGKQSKTLVKSFAQNLGFKYLHASGKEEFMHNYLEFVDEALCDNSIIFEVFTTNDDEYESLRILQNTEPKILEQHARSVIRKIMGENNIKKIKKIIR